MDDLLDVFEAGNSGPPEGAYVAVFSGYKPTDHDQWGPGVCFSATVDEGEHEGSVSMRTSKRNPTGKNLCGRLITGLTGKKIQAGEKIDIKHLIGKKFQIIVTSNKDGDSTRLESFKRLPAEDYDN